MRKTVTVVAVALVSFLSIAMTPLAGPSQYRGAGALSHHSSHFSYKAGAECEVGPHINNVGLGRHTMNTNEFFKVKEKCASTVDGGLESDGP